MTLRPPWNSAYRSILFLSLFLLYIVDSRNRAEKRDQRKQKQTEKTAGQGSGRGNRCGHLVLKIEGAQATTKPHAKSHSHLQNSYIVSKANVWIRERGRRTGLGPPLWNDDDHTCRGRPSVANVSTSVPGQSGHRKGWRPQSSPHQPAHVLSLPRRLLTGATPVAPAQATDQG